MFIDHDSDVCYSWVSIKVAYGLAIQYPVDKGFGQSGGAEKRGTPKSSMAFVLRCTLPTMNNLKPSTYAAPPSSQP